MRGIAAEIEEQVRRFGLLASFKRLGFEPVFRFAMAGKDGKRRVEAGPIDNGSERDGKVPFYAQGRGESFAVVKIGPG